MTAIRIICCILFGIASVCDERERLIPRIVGVLTCLFAILGWCIQFFINRQFDLGNLVVSGVFFGILIIFYMKDQIGLGDLFLVFSMLILLSCGQPTLELLWKENLLFCIAFFSVAIRMLIQRVRKKRKEKEGCPFALHLFAAYLITSLC